MRKYEFSAHERRVIMSALEYADGESEIRTRLNDYSKGSTEAYAEVLFRFAADTCWDKLEGEA